MVTSKKIRILFYGDAPTVATGFGTVSRNILMGLHETGKYDISVLGVNYWGDPHPFPFPIWPVGVGSSDPYGRQKCVDMMSHNFDYDVLFLFQDSFILQSFMDQALSHLRRLKKFVTVGYYPIDGVPKKSWVDCMNTFDVPVTYTEFGKKESIAIVPSIADKIQVIPHGVNVKDFFPLKKEQADSFRRQYFANNADKFIVTNLNRNQQRKDIPRTLLAFKEFKKLRPNSVLYLHMAPKDQGWNLLEVLKATGLSLNEDVLFPGNDFSPNQGFSVSVVNGIYNASDVVISTTLGEGWGLSSTEAMACKTPVIFPDNTALTEIVGAERGYLVKSGATPSDYTILPHDNEIVRPTTDVGDLVEKLVDVYDNREEAKRRAENAYSWVTSNLIWKRDIVPQWDKLITGAVSDWIKSQNAAPTSSSVISAEEL